MRKIGFAAAWGDYLLDLAIKGFGSHRYWADHKLRGTPPRTAGRKRHTPGVPTHNRPRYLQRYGAKRVVGELG